MNAIFFISSFPYKVALLFLSITLFGCSQTVQHEWSSVEQKRPPRETYSGHSVVPEKSPTVISSQKTNKDIVKPQRHSEVMTSSPSREEARIEQVLQRIGLKNRLYVAKDGSLMGDFTLHNHNPLPVSKIMIECAEYNPHHELLRTSARIVSAHTTLPPHGEQRFEQIDFGYVENGFDTVNCHLQSVKVG